MKTSLIRFRVADFLKQYPPFDGLPEPDLFELAGTGRVSFHEADEYVFRRGRPRKPSIWVIQQGAVEIVDESADGGRLADLLGAGDILGLFDPTGGESYSQSARTRGDVILYSIDARAFEAQASRHPRVARYLAAHFSAADGQQGQRSSAARRPPARSCFDSQPPSLDFLRARTAVVAPDCSIREAATLMSERGRDAVVIVDAARKPRRVISQQALSRALAGGAGAETDVARVVAEEAAIIAGPALGWPTYLSAMLRSRRPCIAITRDGTGDGVLEGLLTSQDVSLLLGANPLLLQTQLLQSRSVVEWKVLLNQVRIFLLQALTGPAVLKPTAETATFLYDALVESIVGAAEADLKAQGVAVPDVASCWLMLGRAGRGEMIEPLQPRIGVVYADPEAGQAAAVAAYFARLAAKVRGYLTECRLEPATAEDGPPLSMPRSAWESMLRGVILDPVGNNIYGLRGCLDFRAFFGDQTLEQALVDVTTQAMRDSQPFIPILANDTLENLPPLTFFDGLVIELDGARKGSLDLEATALRPIVDAVRVYALAAGNLAAKNTLDRLAAASNLADEAAAVMREVGSAFRTVSYYHAAAALTRQSSATTEIRPNQLGRYDQRMLKLAFQTIRSLMELVPSSGHWRSAS